MIQRTRSLAASLAVSLAFGAGLPAMAQSLFSPAAYVDEAAITEFEVTQRQRLLELFRAPDASRQAALDALIDERVQLAEAARQGIVVTQEDQIAGETEFAGRADLEREPFLAEIARAGIDPATFADFVRAGVAWRQVVQARFGGSATDVPQDQVEAAADGPPDPALRVLLNEIIIPADTPERAARAEALIPEIQAIDSYAEFAAAARAYSATPSRERGGAIDWLELSNLPPQLAQILTGLAPGQVSPPIPLPNALAFFQLREIGEIASQGTPSQLDYAALYLPGGQSPESRAEAARIAAEVAVCDDLYPAARRTGGQVQRDTLPIPQIPQDVALELARLDRGEVSTALTRAEGQTLVVLMLCDRIYRAPDAEAPDLNRVRQSLINQRIAQKAENLLAELRANANIRQE